MDFGIVKVTTDWPEAKMCGNKRCFSVTVENVSNTITVSEFALHIDLDDNFTWWDERSISPKNYLKISTLLPNGIVTSNFKAKFYSPIKHKEEHESATLTFAAVFKLSFEGEHTSKSIAEFTLSLNDESIEKEVSKLSSTSHEEPISKISKTTQEYQYQDTGCDTEPNKKQKEKCCCIIE